MCLALQNNSKCVEAASVQQYLATVQQQQQHSNMAAVSGSTEGTVQQQQHLHPQVPGWLTGLSIAIEQRWL